MNGIDLLRPFTASAVFTASCIFPKNDSATEKRAVDYPHQQEGVPFQNGTTTEPIYAESVVAELDGG